MDQQQQNFYQMMGNFASTLIGNGFRVIPINGKIPKDKGWYTNNYSAADMRERTMAGCNIGMPLGVEVGDGTALVSFDADIPDIEAAKAVRAIAPDTAICIGKAPKFKFLARVPEAEAYSRDYTFRRQNGHGDEKITIQVLGHGKQAAVFGVHPETGKLYFWDADSKGRKLFDMTPPDFSLIENVEAFIGLAARALEPFGWSRGGSGRGGGERLPQAFPDGVEIPDRVLNAVEAHLDRELEVLRNTGPGQDGGRGTKAFLIGCHVGFALRDGGIDHDQVRNEVSDALGDNQKDLRQFDNGVARSDGQQFAEESFEKAAADLGIDINAACQALDAFLAKKEQQGDGGRDGYRIALDTLRKDVVKRNVLRHGTDTAYASIIAEAATVSWRGSLYRSMAGDVVRVMPVAGAHGLNAPKGSLAEPAPPQVTMTIPTDADVKIMIKDAVQTWERIKIPDEGGPSHIVIKRDPNGEDISWSGTGFKVEGVKTAAWARRAGHNLGREAWIEDGWGWEKRPLPKGEDSKAVIGSFRAGAGTAGTPRLRAISTAPSFGRDGRLLMKDGPLEVAAGEIIYTVQGHLRGRIKLMEFKEAQQHLLNFLKLFPFADGVSESVGLSLFLGLVARGAFSLSPAYVIDAPEYGSGKTFLAEKMGAFSGQPLNSISCGAEKGEEELAKRFETALMTDASGMLLLDDVPDSKMPDFPTMRTYLTATTPELKIRRFGKNDEHKTVRTDSTTLVVTGMAVEVGKDMVRRVVRMYLDNEAAKARMGWNADACLIELEAIYADPDKHGKLLGAALSVLDHNWRVRPAPLPTSKNFGGWSRVVREACQAVTGHDPEASRIELEGLDADQQQWAELMENIHAVAGDKPFTVAELLEAAQAAGNSFGSMGMGAAPKRKPIEDIADAFELGKNGANSFSKRASKFLHKHLNRNTNTDGTGVCLRKLPLLTKSRKEHRRWQFEGD
jgi:hypothetical protein